MALFLRSRPGKEVQLADRLATLRESFALGPRVIIYDLHRSTGDPVLWLFYERYESQEHLERHLKKTPFCSDDATLLDGKLNAPKVPGDC